MDTNELAEEASKRGRPVTTAPVSQWRPARLAQEKSVEVADQAYADLQAKVARLKAESQIAQDALRHAASQR